MSNVRPLSLDVLRPAWTAEVPAPPHDALTPAERRDHLRRFPLSYLGVTRAPEDAGSDTEVTADQLLVDGRRALERLLDRDVFEPADGPRFFVYRLAVDGRRQTGLVAGVAVDDYDRGEVRIHEQIKQDRARHLADHLAVVRAQSSPIALACADHLGLGSILDRVTSGPSQLDFITLDGLRQTIWPIHGGDDTTELMALLQDEPLYLTDGHHRAAAAASFRAGRLDPRSRDEEDPAEPELPGCDWMLSAVFPAGEMYNRAFHRFITVDSFAHLRQRLADRLDVQPATYDGIARRAPSQVPLLGRDGDGRFSWYLVDLPRSPGHVPSTVIDNLDPVRLREHVLHPVLDIDEARSGGRLVHRPGSDDPATVEPMLEPGEVVFVMRPVAMSELVEASDAGLTMPPKSTYFEPKVRSGIFLHRKQLV